MNKEEIKRLHELLLQFRSTFLSTLSTEERHALVKTILTVDFNVESEEVEVLSGEERPRW